MRFLSQRGFSPVQTLNGALLPARRSVAEERGVWAQMDPDVAQAISAILSAEERYTPPSPGDPEHEVYSALCYAIQQVKSARADADIALANAQQEAIAAIAKHQERLTQARSTPVSIATALPRGEGAIVVFLAGEDVSLYEPLAAEFNRQHADLHVAVSDRLDPGASADCRVMNVVRGDLALPDARRQLFSLTPLLDTHPEFPLTDFYPEALDAATWAGELWFLPAALPPLILYSNPALFTSAGEPLPTDHWSVQEMLEAAGRLSRPEQGLFGYLPTAAPEVPFLLDQQGIALFEVGALPHPRFAEADVVAALDSLRRLGDSGRVLQDPLLTATRIREGRVALWFNIYAPLSPTEIPPRAHATAIRQRSGTSIPLSVSGWGLDADSAQPEGCWRWMTWLTDRAIVPGDGLSARRSVAESQIAQEGAEAGRYQAMMTALTQAVTRHPREEEWEVAVKGWMLWWFYRALGDADLETALSEAQTKATAFLTCLGEAAREMDTVHYEACAREADPEHAPHRR